MEIKEIEFYQPTFIPRIICLSYPKPKVVAVTLGHFFLTVEYLLSYHNNFSVHQFRENDPDSLVWRAVGNKDIQRKILFVESSNYHPHRNIHRFPLCVPSSPRFNIISQYIEYKWKLARRQQAYFLDNVVFYLGGLDILWGGSLILRDH